MMVEATQANFGAWLTNAGLREPTLRQRGDGWGVWNAQSFQDGSIVLRWYVFANASCSWAELERAVAAVGRNAILQPYTVIFPHENVNQLAPENQTRLRSTCPNANTISLQRLYYSAALNRNLLQTEGLGVDNFVDQRVSFPGFSEPQPALTTLVQWLRGEIKTSQKIVVLLAPGGQGKTTVTRQIFHHFATRQYEATIPVLINRDSWESDRDIVDLDDVWRSGIRACYPDAGMADEMLRNCLALGTFSPIFDGLDELCTVNPWDFKPDDVIRELISTFEGNFDGRLLITSRSSFWAQYVSASLRGSVIEADLHNFTPAETDSYLRKRFPSEDGPDALARKEKAGRILARIGTRMSVYQTQGEGFVQIAASHPYGSMNSLPFVVMLAADSADTDKPDLSAAYGSLLESADPLRGLLLAICDREQLRHGLPQNLNAETQLNLLQTLAAEFGLRSSDEDLELVLSEYNLNPDVKTKFGDHSLIVKRKRVYEFVYEFVYDYLCASVLVRWLRADIDARAATNTLVRCAEQPGNLLDGAARLIIDVFGPNWVALAQARYTQLAQVAGIDRRWQAGLFHLSHSLARHEPQQDQRLSALSTIFGEGSERTLQSFFIEGAIDNLDFRRMRFRNVTFGEIEFARCQFDNSTVFEECIFTSTLDFESCRGAGLVLVTGGMISVQARSALQREQVEGIDNRLTAEQVEDALRLVLKKFNRGVGTKTVLEENIRGAMKSAFAFGNDVIDYLIRCRVLEPFQSATRHNLKVIAKADVYELFHNNYKRGRVKEAYDELVKRLVE